MKRHRLNVSPGDNGPIFIGVNHCNPIIRVKTTRTSSGRTPGPRFTSLVGNRSVSAVALRRTLGLFSLPQAINRCRNGIVITTINHFKPFVHRSNGFISVPGSLGPLAVATRRTVTLVRKGEIGSRRHFVGGFRRSPRVRVLGNHFNPCVSCRGTGCHVPGAMASPAILALRSYGGVVTRTKRGPTTGGAAHGGGT